MSAFSGVALPGIPAELEHAEQCLAQGRFADAEGIWRGVLSRDAQQPDALHGIAMLAILAGHPQDAEQLARQAVGRRKSEPRYRVTLGRALAALGRHEEAVEAYRAALRVKPDLVDALVLLGIAWRNLRRHDEAIAVYQRATRMQPACAEAHANCGIAYQETGRLAEAVTSYEHALRLRPGLREVRNNLGLALGQSGQWQAALRVFESLNEQSPDYAEGFVNTGLALKELQRLPEAIACFRRAIALKPSIAEAHANLGNALRESGDLPGSIASLRMAIEANPRLAAGHSGLGMAFEHQGLTAEAIACHARALEQCRDDGLRIRRALALPIVPQSLEEIRFWRERLASEVRALAGEPLNVRDPAEEVATTTFFLSYHGQDNRALQENVARLHAQACPSLLWQSPHCARWRGPQAKIRIGFISKHFRNHSIGKTSKGLMAMLDRSRFEVSALFLSPLKDDETARFIRGNSDRSAVLPARLAEARQAIADLELDILFYQDIGMEPFTYFLAFSRLAPVQCVSFGHPETTGIGNMDAFISSALFEAPGAQDHYSERLELLPDAGTLAYYYRPQPAGPARGRADFGLPADAHLYICPQTLFKLHPDFDGMLAQILDADPLARLLLLEAREPNWGMLMRRRLTASLGGGMDRVDFLAHQTPEDFIRLIGACDVMLDTPHFNGMNTSLEAFSTGTPVVTLPMQFQRSRHTHAMYRRMGLEDCIARDAADYVSIALRLGTDADWNRQVRAQIRERCAVLYEDTGTVRDFEACFERLVARAQGLRVG